MLLNMDDEAQQSRGLGPDIYVLLESLGLASNLDEILRIATLAEHDPDSAFLALQLLDQNIPGLGLHNLNNEDKDPQGPYVLADRPIFRPIQYVGQELLVGRLAWLARDIVEKSGLHVEQSLKRRFGITTRRSMGQIIGSKDAKVLDGNLKDDLKHLCYQVYNQARHEIGTFEIDEHMFSIADAIAVYLGCRVLGSRILKGSGITNNQGQPIFD